MASLNPSEKKEWEGLFNSPDRTEFPSIQEGLVHKPPTAEDITTSEPASSKEAAMNEANEADEAPTPGAAAAPADLSGTPIGPALPTGINATAIGSFKMLPVGATVVVKNLVSESGRLLNGRRATVLKMDLNAIGRWAVELHPVLGEDGKTPVAGAEGKKGVVKSLKAENLEMWYVRGGNDGRTVCPRSGKVEESKLDLGRVAAPTKRPEKETIEEGTKTSSLRPRGEHETEQEYGSYCAAAKTALSAEERAFLEENKEEDEVEAGDVRERANMRTFFDLDSAAKDPTVVVGDKVGEDGAADGGDKNKDWRDALPGVDQISDIQKALLEKQ